MHIIYIQIVPDLQMDTTVVELNVLTALARYNLYPMKPTHFNSYTHHREMMERWF